MDFVNDLRDATLDAASHIGYVAKGMGEQISSYAEEIGGQMQILGNNISHELKIATGDLGNSVANAAGNIGHSVSSILAKAFHDFVRLVAACETHEEEDIVIQAELGNLKRRFKEKDLRSNDLREVLIRMVYCEMLGYEAPFGYLKAIELCSDPNIVNKKAGYITAAICIPPEHEFRFMIVNRLQMDLQSKNYLEVATALIATSQLLTVDMIPALIHLVYQALHHKESTVLCKAVMLVQRFHQLDPMCIGDIDDELRRLLKSYDVTVLFACISVLHDFILVLTSYYNNIKMDPSKYKDLVSFFSDMLLKIVDNQFDHAYDFDGQCAPWIQMKVIRILSALGHADQTSSEVMYLPIISAMRRADRLFPHHLACAISADCVHAIIKLYPNEELLEEAACVIDRMVNSRDPNLKYLGLDCMADMIQDYPQYVVRLQMVVMNSLDNEDITVRNSTLHILHRMCNSQNVDIIINRFLVALSSIYDPFQRQQLVDKICDLAERFAPEPSWYITTMTQVFAFGGRQVKQNVEATLIKLLSDSQGDETADRQLRCLAVEKLFPLVQDPLAPENLVRVATWIFGEYGHLCSESTLSQLIDVMGTIWRRPALSTETKSYLISAFMKISAQTQTIPTMASIIVRECMRSHDTELVQQAMEFREMCKSGAGVFLAAIPLKKESHTVMDVELRFLDSYVMQSRLEGQKEYEERDLSDDEGNCGLKTDAYEAPEPVQTRVVEPVKVVPKKDGEIDFSAISGSFGFKPAVASPPLAPAPSAADLFAAQASPVADMFGMTSTPTAGETDMFGGMETAVTEPVEVKEEEPEVSAEVAALFGAVIATKPKKVVKPVKKAAAKPANPLFAPAEEKTVQLTAAEKTIPAGISVMASQSDEMFDMMNLSAPVSAEVVVDMKKCRLSATYKIFTKDPCSDLHLLTDDNVVHVASYFIYREGSLVICLFLKSKAELDNVKIDMHFTDGLTSKFVTEPKGDVTGKSIFWAKIGKGEQVTILGSTNFQKPTPSSSLNMGGRIEYGTSEVSRNVLDFEIPFNFVEMIRETPMSTTEYFALWKASKAEQKVDIKSTLRNTRLFAEKANKLFHVAIVDINDVSRTTLLAGKITGTSSTCLMEVNMTNTGCTIFFRTPSSVLCRLLSDASKLFEDM